MKTIWSEFRDIWQQLQVNDACMIIATYLRQQDATIPGNLTQFSHKIQQMFHIVLWVQILTF